jgi:hypothetical protein
MAAYFGGGERERPDERGGQRTRQRGKQNLHAAQNHLRGGRTSH